MSLLKKFRSHKTPDEKKMIRKERLLLILSGVLLGISFPPFPFPFTLLLFVGFIPYHQIKRYYSIADIFPFPRQSTPTCRLVPPLKIFEAMAMAKPVIVSCQRCMMGSSRMNESRFVSGLEVCWKSGTWK